MSLNFSKISIKNVHKSFGGNIVLDGLNLEIQKGQSMVIIGASGTGKSVLLKNIIGLLQPDQGSIKINGEETVGISWNRKQKFLKKVGMLFQNAGLFDSLTVWENVAFPLLQDKSFDRKRAQKKAIEKLSEVGLTSDTANLMPAELSGGMKKRVGLARAIATDPEIIFFDEPTTGLDPIMGEIINELIIEKVQQLGATTLSITHDISSAKKIGTKIAMIYGGKIIWVGEVSELNSSGNKYVDQFIQGSAEGPIQMDFKPC
tara:strand:+ start:2640 stop:3419 length:780 start_codon:yes stop_codon:yes gene_type:complete